MRVDEAMQVIAGALHGQVSPAMLTSEVRTTLLNLCGGGAVAPGVAEAVVTALEPFLGQMGAGSYQTLSGLYEEALRWEVRTDGVSPMVVPSGGERRKSGRYYTPEVITRYMAERARYYNPDARAAIDPACGAGAFLRALQGGFGGARLRLMGLDSDPLALALCRALVPEAELREADALVSEAEGDHDICLANPPYVTGGLRGMRGHKDADWAQLRSRYSLTSQYKFSTYPMFVERGLQLVRPGGVAGYILPDSFLTGRYFEGLRRLLMTNTLLELTLIRKDFWTHGRVGQSVILFVRKTSPPPNHQVLVRVIDQPDALEQTPYTPFLLSELTWGKHLRFRLATRAGDRSFIRDLEAGSPLRMRDLVQTYSGLIGRLGQRSLLLSDNPGWTGPRDRLLRSGSEVDRYSVRWAGDQVCLDPALIKSGGNFAYYRQPKLLMRQTADSLRAAYDETGIFCLNNLHLIIARHDLETLRPTLALINSDTLNRYYSLSAMESGRLYAQVDLDLFEDLPVPDLDEPIRSRLTDLVMEMENAAPEVRAAKRLQAEGAVGEAYGLG